MLVGEPVRLHSPLTPLEIRDRLKPELRWSLVEAGLMLGRASARRLFLWLPQERYWYWQRRTPLALTAGMTAVADGTLISGSFRTHPGSLLGLIVLIGVLTAFCVATGGFDLGAFALLAVPVSLQIWGMMGSHGDKAELLDLLDILIGATPA